MKDLQMIDGIQRMSSREIAELTGKQHGHVLRDIRELVTIYENKGLSKLGLSDYVNKQGKTYQEYLLTKMQTFDLLTGYSAELRITVNRRWEELENERKVSLPDFSNPVEAARAWADEYEKRQIAENENEVMKPKALFYDQVADSSKTIDMALVAKTIDMGIGRNKLFSFLRKKKILNKYNTPYQTYVDREYFRVIESKFQMPDGTFQVNFKTVVYQKGIDFIIKLLKQEGEIDG